MDIRKHLLDNGLRVLIIPEKGAKSATALILVGTGSRYEKWEVNGISHFLEHLFFKGTKKRPTTFEISSLIDSLGAEYNAFTGKEETGYYVKAASEHLETMIDVLSDMLQNSLFQKEEVEREKGVITEEINMYEDTPARKIGDIYESLLFGDHPLGWDIAGRKEIIKSLDRKDFIEYMDEHYTPENMVFIVAGGVDEKKTLELVKKYAGKLPKKAGEEFIPFKEEQKAPGLRVQFKATDQAHLYLGFRTYSITHPDKYVLDVLATILGGGMSSRMFINVRERKGLAYYIQSSSENYLDAGTLYTRAGVDLNRIDDAIKVILEEYQKISTQKVTPAELKKAKDYTRGKLILELEDSRSVANFVGNQELLERKILTEEEVLRQIDKVTAEDILRVAKDIMVNNKLNLAVIGPFKEEARFSKLLKI
jgi:predicted Zn-dependent peptidase